MGIRRNKNNIVDNISNIEKSNQTIVENAEKISRKLDNIEHDTKVIAKNSKSKLAITITIIALIVSSIGVFITYLQYKESHITSSQYEIYLSCEFTKIKVYAENELTATLNFDTDSISISAYLNSVLDGDILTMVQKTKTEWYKKVYFEHIGTYEVIATAIAPNGETIEKSIIIEVVP